MMDKLKVTAFFDRLAPTWDHHLVHNDVVIDKILDAAQIREDICVLDVACGTGVLFPDYLARNVKKITGVDISGEMLHIAETKYGNEPGIELIHGDIEMVQLPQQYECCVVYNAFPHFGNPPQLIGCLAEKLMQGGRLTIAHGMSRAAIDVHHSGSAKEVSLGLMHEDELAQLMERYFHVDVKISDAQMYIVSGCLK